MIMSGNDEDNCDNGCDYDNGGDDVDDDCGSVDDHDNIFDDGEGGGVDGSDD